MLVQIVLILFLTKLSECNDGVFKIFANKAAILEVQAFQISVKSTRLACLAECMNMNQCHMCVYGRTEKSCLLYNTSVSNMFTERDGVSTMCKIKFYTYERGKC